MQLRRKCPCCHGYGYLYSSSSPEARRELCERCLGEGEIEIEPEDIAGRRVRLPCGIEGECCVWLTQIIVLADDDTEYFASMEELELCVPL